MTPEFKLPPASVARIIEAQIYDASVLLELRTRLSEVYWAARTSFGILSRSPNTEFYLDTCAKLIEILSSAVSGNLSPGEAYTGIIPVDKYTGKPAGRSRRVVYLVLKHILPTILPNETYPSGRIGTMRRVASALFYIGISGPGSNFAARILGLRLVALDPFKTEPSYRWVGLLMLAREIVTSIDSIMLPPKLKNLPSVDLADSTALPYIPQESRTCSLCLTSMKDPSCSPCGHIFCWSCLLESTQHRPECPLCRRACLQQEILPLR